MTSNTALQVTNFNFYGDELIALKDNATGEIYTSINSVLRGIGFTDKNQIRKRRDKWINDIVLAKGIEKFILSTQEVVSKNGTTLFDEKETYCISHKKLPLALAKINITPSMKKTQKQLVEGLSNVISDLEQRIITLNKNIKQLKFKDLKKNNHIEIIRFLCFFLWRRYL